jgi:glycine hydroxymethyltransferase
VTTRGFREPEIREVATLIADVLDRLAEGSGLEETTAAVRRRVHALTERFPLYQWKLAPVGAV